jgi:hypothetical protein
MENVSLKFTNGVEIKVAHAHDYAEFDVAEALYWIGADFHSGQFSPEYRLLCATEFHPGRSANGPESGSLAELLYNELSEFVSN